ncbi:MAG: hypothetical protein ACREJM_01950, partial [Candidatus Saccharimonadales bacterium]
ISSSDEFDWFNYTGTKQTWIDSTGVLHCLGGCTGTGLTLETNGATNADQSLLNLVAGTNVTLSNTGGAVTINSTGGGTPITLQTNGTNNASQSLLNLVAGTNITLTNTGGAVTITSTASGTGLPSTWTVGAGNAVIAAPTATDVTTFEVKQSSVASPTADVFDVMNSAGTVKYL